MYSEYQVQVLYYITVAFARMKQIETTALTVVRWNSMAMKVYFITLN
jgi:hypothetical protein